MIGWVSLVAGVLFLLTVGDAQAEPMADEMEDEPSGMPASQAVPAPTPALPAAPVRAATPLVQPSDETASYGGPLWSRGNLFGDPGGYRSAARMRGLTFTLEEQAEVLGNLTGGTRRGAVVEGALSMGVALDTGKAGLWPGGLLNVSAYQIHGRGLSLNHLGNNLNTVSGLEALPGTLLYELWYQQEFFGGGLNIRVGQLAADQEFMVSNYSELFLNNAFGWPTLAGADLPSGGPAFPLATPGARLRAKPLPNLTILLGVFNGDPAGPGEGLPQTRNASGTAFRVNDGALVIGEVQYTIGGVQSAMLPGSYKLGAWYNSARLSGQPSSGVDIGSSISQKTAGRTPKGNWSIYGLADQMLFRKSGTEDEGIGVFLRVLGAPGDRNLVNVSADFGLTWKGIVPGRTDDTAGVGFGLARVSSSFIHGGGSFRTLGGSGNLSGHTEAVLELTYQAQLAPWWQVQPTAQYLSNLGGGARNSEQPGKRLGNSAVLGLRTAVTF